MDLREKLIKKYIKEKSVLDLGAADIRDRFLHKFIHDNAKKAVGVELDKIKAQKLIDLGYDIRVGNAETLDLKEKFDVVMAGDLIEHINNVGIFFESVKKHLDKNGIFIFNTPNAYAINFLLRGLLMGGNVPQFYEHAYLFTEDLLKELLKRHNLKINDIVYFTHPNKNLKSMIIRFLSFFFKKWNENILIIAHA